MAWNEPGNNGKNNDPWGKKRGGKDQGPPDLEDVFQDLFGKIGQLFGGGKPSGNSGKKPNNLSKLFSYIGIIAVIGWVIVGAYTVEESSKGVELRFGKFTEITDAGLRWRMPFIEKVQIVDVQSIFPMPAKGSMLTQDDNVVEVDFEIQYRVVDPRNYLFSVTDPTDSLKQATESAIRYVIGHSQMDSILTDGRELVREQTRQELLKIIEPYNLGVEIVDVNFKDARPPQAVKAAFDDAISAQEDEERFVREAEAYARGIEPQARGRVQRVIQEAQAYKERKILEAKGKVARFESILPFYKEAPAVTKQRLYLETMEAIYGSTSKVFVDVKGGNNMMYLPLDKIIQSQPSRSTAPKNNNIDIEQLKQEFSRDLPSSSEASSRSSSRSGRG